MKLPGRFENMLCGLHSYHCKTSYFLELKAGEGQVEGGIHVHKDVLTDNVFLYEDIINHRSHRHHLGSCE